MLFLNVKPDTCDQTICVILKKSCLHRYVSLVSATEVRHESYNVLCANVAEIPPSCTSCMSTGLCRQARVFYIVTCPGACLKPPKEPVGRPGTGNIISPMLVRIHMNFWPTVLADCCHIQAC